MAHRLSPLHPVAARIASSLFCAVGRAAHGQAGTGPAATPIRRWGNSGRRGVGPLPDYVGGSGRAPQTNVAAGPVPAWRRAAPPSSVAKPSPHPCGNGIAHRGSGGSDVAHGRSLERFATQSAPPVEAYRQLLRPCFVTVRATHGAKPFRDATLNNAVIEVLLAERLRTHCNLYVYCLMPDHLHLVAAPGAEGSCTLRYMREFKSRSTRIAWGIRRRGRLWQPGFFDIVLRTEESLRQTYWYVLANPVRAGLVSEPDAYPWSGEPDPVPW